VHFPTDINLLWDSVRKSVVLTANLSTDFGLTIWRQYEFNLRQFKKLYRIAQKIKHSTSKSEEKKKIKVEELIKAYQNYLDRALLLINRIESTLNLMSSLTSKDPQSLDIFNKKHITIQAFITHAIRQIDQIERRVIKGEKIPHKEKVFSIFEEHTEWISKGKAGVPVELGLRVCVLNDQLGFTLHHCVMEKETDELVAVPMVKKAKERFSQLKSCSFDKGFHSVENQVNLKKYLDFVVLPKKGKCNKYEHEHQNSEGFKTKRRQHSAVESDINALEIHGLDKCPDQGIVGFKRYVALAILGRNIQKLGALLLEQEMSRRKKKLAA